MNKKVLFIALTITCLYSINTFQSFGREALQTIIHSGNNTMENIQASGKQSQQTNNSEQLVTSYYNNNISPNNNSQHNQQNNAAILQYPQQIINPNMQYNNQSTQNVNNKQIVSKLNFNKNNLNNNSNIVQQKINNSDVSYTSVGDNILTKSIENNQEETANDNPLIVQASDLLKKLYLVNSRCMFNSSIFKEFNREQEDGFRVDFQCTKELCKAMLAAINNNDIKPLTKLILTDKKQYIREYEAIFEQCIKDMINNFKDGEDLAGLYSYLNITNGKATYTPISAMSNWLKSLAFFEDIKDIAKPFLEENDNENTMRSYELRICFYFHAGNQSKIAIPKIEQIPLLLSLNQIENELNKVIIAKNIELNGIKNYKEKLAAFKLQEELQALAKNPGLIKLNELKEQKIQKDNLIKEQNTQKSKPEATKHNAQKELNTIPKSLIQYRTVNGIKQPVSYTGTNKNESTKFNTAQKTIKTAETEIQKIDDQIKKLNIEMEPITKQISELEEKYKDIIQQQKDKQEQLKKYPELTDDDAHAIKYINKKYDNQILDQLTAAKKLFSTDPNIINPQLPANNKAAIHNNIPVMTNINTNVAGG